MNEFLRESWGRLAEEEKQEEKPETDPRVSGYLELKNIQDNLPAEIPLAERQVLQDLFDTVMDTLERYNSSILSYNFYKSQGNERIDRKNLESVDESRRRTHDALIDSLKVLVRRYKENKLDTNWKDVIGLNNRHSVQDWAQEVARYLGNKREEVQ